MPSKEILPMHVILGKINFYQNIIQKNWPGN